MRLLSLLLLLCAAAAAIPEEMEGLETLVALNAPQSEEADEETKKVRLTLFDSIDVVPPKEPQLKYISPKTTTTTAASSTTTAASAVESTMNDFPRPAAMVDPSITLESTTNAAITEVTTAASIASATTESTTISTASTETTPTTTLTPVTSAAEKKEKKLVQLATQKPILIPIPLPDKKILKAIVETSEPILIQLPYLPKVAGVLTAGQSIQGNPWGTESISDLKSPPINELTVTPPIPIGSELDMGETSPFLPGDSLHLPPIPPSIDQKKGEGKMNGEEMEQAQILMNALRAMKSEVEETLRQINEGEKSTLKAIEGLNPSPISLPPTTSILSTTTSSAPSTTSPSSTSTTHTPSSTTSSSISSSTRSSSTSSTRCSLPVDEVKSTEAVQIDSEGGEVKTKVIPNNDAVVIVDNSAIKHQSRRLVGYTKRGERVVDNDHSRVKKVRKTSHDNSFLPSEENAGKEDVRAELLPKKRHLIENGEKRVERVETVVVKRIRKKLRKRIKKVVLYSPTTPLSSPSTPTSSSSTPPPLPPLLTLPPLPTPTPAETRRLVLPRATESQVPIQHQVSPAAVQPLQLQLPVVARAAPIYRPELYPSLATQPQFYPPPPPSQLTPLSFQPLLPLQQQPLPILRYEPVVYYRPVYGRKKRETEKKRHSLIFQKEHKEVQIKKGEGSRFSLLHSVISPSISSEGKRKHERIFEKKEEKIVVRRVNEEEKKNATTNKLPKSPILRKQHSLEAHTRTKRVKRGADLSEVNKELDENEKALRSHQRRREEKGERKEKHVGVEELTSELEMIEKMKRRTMKEIETIDLMEDEEESEEEEEEEKEEEEKATPSYKKSPTAIEELRSLEDSVKFDHEQMNKHPEGELRLNKGERPKLFSGRRTRAKQSKGIDPKDYEYDAQIADSFFLPASDNELEELYHARLRAAELAPVSPTAAPLRRRRHRKTTPREEEVEEEGVTKRKRRRMTTTTERPTTESLPRTRRPATIIPNFHPKEASPDSASLASLPSLNSEEETTTLRARALRRNRHTMEPVTTTETPETTTRREGRPPIRRPPRVLPKKESSFSLPNGQNRFFYARDAASQVVTRSPPQAPPTLTPPTLNPRQTPPTISPTMSIDELAVLPREALLAELERLSEQLTDRLEEEKSVPFPPRDEEIVDEEDRELRDAIEKGEKKENDPFEFIKKETTTTVPTTTTQKSDLFSFALPSSKNGERLTVEDLVVSDAVNEASIGQDIDKILADVGVGDNSIGTRKRAIEAIMELKKKKNGVSRAKACQPSSCTEDNTQIPKDDYELVSQLKAVNMKHPLAKEGKFSLFATNKKSYYILPDGRVLVVNEKSKLARTNSGDELHLDEESYEEPDSGYSPDATPTTTATPAPTTVAPRRRTKATEERKRVKTTTTPFSIEETEYEENEVESATIAIRPKILPVPPRLPEMKKVVIPWRTTTTLRTTTSIPISTTTKRVFIHDGGIEPSQISVFATPRTPLKSTIVVHKDEEKKHFPRQQESGIIRWILGARTLENSLSTMEEKMTSEDPIKYLESIDLAKTFGGKSLDGDIPDDEKFEKAVSKTAKEEEEEDYSDAEYEDSVTEQQKKPATSSQVNADPKTVDDIDLRKWFTIGKENGSTRRKKGDGMAETILKAASEVPDEEMAEDEFLADESVNLFPDDFVRVLRSVAGGEKVPMRMLRRLGLRLRKARLRRH